MAGALFRCAAATGSGALLFLSFPPLTMWFLAPVGIAVLTLVLRGRSLRAGFGYGYLAGLAFFVPLLPWVGVYVGAVPWLILAAIEAVAVALFGLITAAVGRLPGAAMWVSGAWVVTEAIRSRVPFGGFPWGRIAFGQADGPLLPLAGIVGAPGLSFAAALVGAGLAGCVVGLRSHRWRSAVVAGTIPVGVPLLVALVLSAGSSSTDAGTTATAAVVQGNVPRLGLDFNAQRRAVLDNHLARTEQLAADVAAGRAPRPSLVIWPENASDIDPLRNRDAAARLDAAARSMGTPILVGAVLVGEGGTTVNSVMVWDPARGPGEQHIKRQLVPFGEYLPLRPVMTALSPYAKQAGNFVAGTGDGVVDLNGVRLAVATCYEVAFDDLVTESVRAGAQVITVPTNNATFGRTDMTYQQLAMSRIRAVEHGRSVLIAATSGVSAIIAPDGTVQQQTALFTADALVGEIALGTDLTWATRLGSVPEVALSFLLVPVFVTGLRRSGRGRPGGGPVTSVTARQQLL
ncbi:apolipoprotein N-acyltransferase (plasmid) [Rhodococcus pseudokoreensis]|uniref:Apolipoprotein N-acyltransferase n=1 Tax=Rhodococcus pseudokoreensis TaxID=2811421 RepID=A0A974VY45_9NOCA|nr:apolipoprotein N-acyltransferase [Rhodococcus pseudokoreensis]QSE87780.1 apolipoprotein N-acyltransferase [Rhodococcus pseudokoreensis]